MSLILKGKKVGTEINSPVIFIGEITFVEDSQSDYDELYSMYNIDDLNAHMDKPNFCIVHKINYTSTNIDEVEDSGDSYIIPDIYSGVIIWEQNRF